ncbi:MAG: XdhC family protein [Sedimentisphaerales bacterium]|nr:XdhC family protein [Sedimentisphaerales bacterium]
MDSNHRAAEICQQVVDFIDKGEVFAVALVLEAKGSTPRKAGVRAIIEATGKIHGTLGGGIVEAEAQRRAVEACRSNQPAVFDMDLYGADRAADAPICGGSMRIVIDPTAAKDRKSYAWMTEAIRKRQRGVMLTTVRTAKQTETCSQWFVPEVIRSEAPFPGVDKINSYLTRETPELFYVSTRSPDTVTEVFVEPVIPKPLLLIAGGGHIGQALALQASLVGFDVTVIDDRAEFTESNLYPEGTTTHCCDIPKKTAALSAGDDTYVVLVTRGHKLDAETLEACINAPVAYVGMIGSRRKVALIRRNFIESGIATAEQFDRIFTPIGLDIGAVTVPEIAASITAELIAVRRKGLAHRPSKKMEQP